MKTILKAGSMLCLGSMLSFAESWTGKLVDANCKDKQSTAQPEAPLAACEPTRATTSYGVELSDGRVLRLDGAGNAKAAEAVKTGSAKSMRATVTGSLDGSTVKVESIDIQ
jgi:hypothetical protein